MLKWPRYYSTINIFQTLFFSNDFVLNISRRRRYRNFLLLKREHSFSHVHLLNSLYVAAAKLFFSCVLSPLSCSSNKFVFLLILGCAKHLIFFVSSSCSSSSQGLCVEFYYKSVEGVRICCAVNVSKQKNNSQLDLCMISFLSSWVTYLLNLA